MASHPDLLQIAETYIPNVANIQHDESAEYIADGLIEIWPWTGDDWTEFEVRWAIVERITAYRASCAPESVDAAAVFTVKTGEFVRYATAADLNHFRHCGPWVEGLQTSAPGCHTKVAMTIRPDRVGTRKPYGG